MRDEKAGQPGPGLGTAAFFGLSGLGLVTLAAVFRANGTPWLDSVKFLAGLTLGVFVPGWALLKTLRVRAGRLESLVLALVAGMTAFTTIYRIGGLLRAPAVFWAWLVLGQAAFVVLLVKRPPRRADFSFRIRPAGLGLAAVALLVFGLQTVDNFRNGVRLADGSLRFSMHYYDGFTRNTLVRELTHSIPPQAPFAAGTPISYHYDMNLFAAAFYRHLGLDVLDLLHRFSLAFYFAVLLLAAFAWLRRRTRSPGYAALGAFLIFFGSGGFAYVLGLLRPYVSFWGKMFSTMYYLDLVGQNPMLPAMSMILAGLLLWDIRDETKDRGALILAGAVFAGVAGYKLTFTYPLLGALAGTALLYAVFRRDRGPLAVFLTTAALTAPLLLLPLLQESRGLAFEPRLGFNNWVSVPFRELGLPALGQAFEEIVQGAAWTLSRFGTALAALLIYLIGGLGPAVAAVPSLVGGVFRLARDKARDVFLAGLFAAGLAFYFFVDPRLGGYSRNWTVGVMIKLGAFVLLLFFAAKLADWASGRKGRILPAAVAASLVLLSLPTTAQFIWVKHRVPEPKIFDKAFLDAADFLTKNTRPEAVVMHGPKTEYVCFFADRRVMLDDASHTYIHFHLLPAAYEKRVADRAAFFASPRTNGRILDAYGVSHIWVERRKDAVIWKDSLPERIDCPPHALRLIYRNFRYAVYAVE